MKIVQINAVYGFGSTGIIVQDLQKICQDNRIECIVAYSQSKRRVENGYHLGNLLSHKIHALLSRISGKQGYFSICSTLRFLKFLDKYQPDIIHLHNLHGCYINVPMLLRYVAKKSIKVVVTLHDCWFYTGGCSHYTSAGCTKWMNECGNCPKRYDETPALIWDASSKILEDKKSLFGAITNLVAVGVSQWITDEAHRTVFKYAKCLTIHNGIDTKFFHPENSSFKKKLNIKNKQVILAPANKWFLEINRETFEYFSSRLTDNMCMIFIGSGCDEKRLTDKMINCGHISSREEIRDIYNAADVMVNCTREESLSLLNIEVQACGTPVVTYSNTGVKETVNGQCSYAVENGNAKLLWEQVQIVLNTGKEHYSKECIKWIDANYNRDVNYQKYYNLYCSLVSDNKSK